MELETYWNKKFVRNPIRHPTRSGVEVDVRAFIQEKSYKLDKAVNINGLYKGNDDEKIIKILKYVLNRVKYKSDFGEEWLLPDETWHLKRGDCIAEYEKIHTKKGLVYAKDIKLGDLVLSYNFESKKYQYKPIINKWDKGIKPIKRIHFRNGTHIDVTNEHHMLMRKNQNGLSSYIKTDLKDVDLSRWWKRKLPCAKELPYIVKDVNWLTEDHCFIIGHFLAEGFVSKNKSQVNTCGYDIIENIIPKLEKLGIPFTEYKNNRGVPCLRFLKSDFKDYIKILKTNSFDIHLPD